MKKLLFVALAACVVALAACSGGGSTGGAPPTSPPTATPTPTSTPTTAPAAHIRWSWAGALAPNGGKSGVYELARRGALDASPSPIPVLAALCDPRQTRCVEGGHTLADLISPLVTITTDASPAPSSSPDLTLPDNIPTAAPAPSASPFSYYTGTPTGIGCGNISATFPGATGSIPICVYRNIAVGCPTQPVNANGGTGYSTSVSPAYSVDEGEDVSTIADADIYMTGVTCPGAFEATNTYGQNDYELYFPYGATAVARIGATIATTDPSLWTNTFTQITYDSNEGNQYSNYNCGPQDVNCLILFKTKSGTIAIFEMMEGASEGPTDPIYGGSWIGGVYATDQSGAFLPH